MSASLATFNVDSDGGYGHLSAIQLRELPPDTPIPVMPISPGSFAEIRDAEAPRLSLFADVVRGEASARTIFARIEASTHNGGLSSTAGHSTLTRRSMTVEIGDDTRTTLRVETHNGGVSVR